MNDTTEQYKKSLNHIVWADQSYPEYKHLVSSLITTIESQKEENLGMIDHIQKQDSLIHSQKEEIERLLAIIADKEDRAADYFDKEGDK